MYCTVCQKWGHPPAGTRGAWTTRGIRDWNHGTELLRQHGQSKWHREAVTTAAMAQQADDGCSVLALQNASAAKADAERREKTVRLFLNFYDLSISLL